MSWALPVRGIVDRHRGSGRVIVFRGDPNQLAQHCQVPDGRPAASHRIRGANMGPNLRTRCSSASSSPPLNYSDQSKYIGAGQNSV